MDSLKAWVRVDHQTVDTGSPISFSNWPTIKINLESSDQSKLTPAERLNLPAQFVGYNKQPIVIIGALKDTILSAGWEFNEATFLITERRTRCILGLDLQNKVGISNTQKPVQKKKTRFDVLMCEQSDIWKEKFFSKKKRPFWPLWTIDTSRA